MANIGGFIKSVQSRYGMRPVVPFQTPIAIGDVGYLGRDGTWNPVSTLRERFGIEPAGIRSEQPTSAEWEAKSGRDIKFNVYAKGKTSDLIKDVANAELRTEIEFGNSRSFVFAASGVTIRAATVMDAVIEAIRLAYHNRRHLPETRRWDKKLGFIFAVGSAERYVALLTEGSKTTLAVMGKGTVGPPTQASELTAGIRFGSSSSELQKVMLNPAKRCFYRAYRLDPSILKRWDQEIVTVMSLTSSEFVTPGSEVTQAGIAPAAMLGYPPASGFGPGARGIHTLKSSDAEVPSFEETFVAI